MNCDSYGFYLYRGWSSTNVRSPFFSLFIDPINFMLYFFFGTLFVVLYSCPTTPSRVNTYNNKIGWSLIQRDPVLGVEGEKRVRGITD